MAAQWQMRLTGMSGVKFVNPMFLGKSLALARLSGTNAAKDVANTGVLLSIRYSWVGA